MEIKNVGQLRKIIENLSDDYEIEMRIKMNRTIKFRGKSADNGKWITGYYYHECGNTYIVEDRQSLSETSRNVPYVVIPETVGQFTGLFDNNGKEIYEGDIVERIVHQNPCFGFIGNVVFDSNIALFCVEHNKFGSNSRTPFVMPDDWVDKYSNRLECEFEIKGNIYDHPELIKKE